MYRVIESKCWVHIPTGRQASIYGAVPWASRSDRDEWEARSRGWTVQNERTGVVGCGRRPWEDHIDAQEWCDRRNAVRYNPIDARRVAVAYEEVRGLGRYEGEPPETAYFYGRSMEGFGGDFLQWDEHGGAWAELIETDPAERAAFQAPCRARYFLLEGTSTGFISGTWLTPAEADQARIDYYDEGAGCEHATDELGEG